MLFHEGPVADSLIFPAGPLDALAGGFNLLGANPEFVASQDAAYVEFDDCLDAGGEALSACYDQLDARLIAIRATEPEIRRIAVSAAARADSSFEVIAKS